MGFKQQSSCSNYGNPSLTLGERCPRRVRRVQFNRIPRLSQLQQQRADEVERLQNFISEIQSLKAELENALRRLREDFGI